jgi:hypothetical protein
VGFLDSGDSWGSGVGGYRGLKNKMRFRDSQDFGIFGMSWIHELYGAKGTLGFLGFPGLIGFGGFAGFMGSMMRRGLSSFMVSEDLGCFEIHGVAGF